jgi:hypothetical protein
MVYHIPAPFTNLRSGQYYCGTRFETQGTPYGYAWKVSYTGKERRTSSGRIYRQYDHYAYTGTRIAKIHTVWHSCGFKYGPH